MTRAEAKRAKQIEANAKAAYAKHTLRKIEERRWVIGEPGSSTFLTEIVAGIMGTIIFHGDGSTVAIRLHRDADPWYLVRWVAESSIDRLREKCCQDVKREEFDLDIAIEETRELFDDSKAVAAILVLPPEDEHGFHEALYEATGDCEIGDIGMVPVPGLYYAQAAARRLVELMEVPHA